MAEAQTQTQTEDPARHPSREALLAAWERLEQAIAKYRAKAEAEKEAAV